MRYNLFFLLVLLLSSIANAEFIAFGEQTINAHPCESAQSNVTLQNTGTSNSSYDISIDGSAADFVKFNTLQFTLAPGQLNTVQTFYTIPCDAQTDLLEVNVYFNDGTEEQFFTQFVNVTYPDTTELRAPIVSRVIAPCESAEYEINVHNSANFTELYSISVSGHPNAQISEPAPVILPRQNKTLTLSVTPDDCTESGSFPLTFLIESEKSEQAKELALELIITNRDIPLLADGIGTIRTSYEDSSTELSIKNIGDRTTTYTLAIDGITWGSISPSQISLKPGEKKALQLRLQPTEEESTGTYPALFTATVEETGITYSTELIVNLQPPTFFETNPVLAISLAIILIALTIAATYFVRYMRTDAFKTRVQNWKARYAEWKAKCAKQKELRMQKREADRARKLEAQKKDDARKKAELVKRQAREQKLRIRLERKVANEYLRSPHVISKKDLILAKTPRTPFRTLFKTILLLLALLTFALWGVLSSNAEYAVLGFVMLAIILVHRKLRKGRIINKRWKLYPQSATISVWSKGLSQLTVLTENAVQNLQLCVKRARAKTKPSPHVFQTFTITANTEAKFQASFSMPKSWGEVKLARYSNHTWTTVPLKNAGESAKALFFAADLKSGTYAIYAKTPKQTPKSRKLFLGLAALAALVAAAVFIAPAPSPANLIPAQEFDQNTVHTLDLAPYFQDPDKDALTFSTTETKHVAIDVIGTKAVFTPEQDFIGEEFVKFIAHDGKGGEIQSNTVSLRVTNSTVPASLRVPISLGIGILFVLILLFVVKVLHKKK